MTNPDISSQLIQYIEGRVLRDEIDNRGISQYINLLFLDESREHPPAQSYLLHLDTNHQPPIILKALDKQSVPFFGGLRNFFKENTKILDLGSGMGTAVKQLNELLQKINSQIAGVDVSIPTEKTTVVGGEFQHLPFQSGSINRIMCVESFPRWYGDYPSSMRAARAHYTDPEMKIYEKAPDGILDLNLIKYRERVKDTWEELHRIAAPGCIIRGTIGVQRTEGDFSSIAQTFRPLISKGWQIILFSERNPEHSCFVAYLPEK